MLFIVMIIKELLTDRNTEIYKLIILKDPIINLNSHELLLMSMKGIN